MCWLGFGFIFVNLAIILLFNAYNYFEGNDSFYLLNVPVILNTEDIEGLQSIVEPQLIIHMNSTVHTEIGISASFKNHANILLSYVGLQIYKSTILLISLFFFIKLLKNVAEGNAFDSQNFKYLYFIGWILFLFSVLNILIGPLSSSLLGDLVLIEGYKFSPIGLFGSYMMEGICFLALGYVFKEGTRMYEEEKLTV